MVDLIPDSLPTDSLQTHIDQQGHQDFAPDLGERSVNPTVAEPPEPERTATPRLGGPGYEWPAPIRQLRAAFRGHAYRQDALLALCVVLLGFTPQAGSQQNLSNGPVLLVITTVAQSLALAWRRKAPIVVYGAVLVFCSVQWIAGESSSSNLSLLIGLYTLARYWSLSRLPVAVAAMVPSVVVSVIRVRQNQIPEVLNLFYIGAAVAASVALGLVARERHDQLAALAERAAHAEFEREQQARIAVLAERAGFSREMHDIVGHNLAVIIGLADGGVRQVEANPTRGRQVFELIGETGRQALADLRRTLGALRERPLDEGIEGIAAETLTPQPGVTDIAELIDRTRSAGPRVSYRTSGKPSTLPRSLQLAIYRIVQEALTNSLKHAGPDTSVQVAIEIDDESLRVSVADTGSETHRAAPTIAVSGSGSGVPGQGLTGVRERAALAGGRADAGPNHVGGWTVTAQLPLNPPEER